MSCDIPKLLLWVRPGTVVRPGNAQFYTDNMKNVLGIDLGAGLHYSQEDHPKAVGEGIRPVDHIVIAFAT